MRLGRKSKTPESSVMSALRDWLGWKGWMIVRNQQSMGSQPGVPDLTVIREGRVLWIEVKRPKVLGESGKMIAEGELSGAQARFRDDLLRHKGEFVLARSVEDLERYLDPQAAQLERMQVGG